MNTDWIVTYDGSDGKGVRFACLRCGSTYAPALPVGTGMFVATGRAFIKDHRYCKAAEALLRSIK